MSCSTSEDTILTCPHGLNRSTNTCYPGPQDVGPIATEDPGPATPAGDTAPPDFDNGGSTDLKDTAAEDPGPVYVDSGPADGTCNPGLDPMNLKIGMPCTSHTQCESCYCYDEAYLFPFRFCTQNCQAGSGSSCPNPEIGTPLYACIEFKTEQIKQFELSVPAICMPRCQSVADCTIYSGQYNACDDEWEGASIQAVDTCMIKSAW